MKAKKILKGVGITAVVIVILLAILWFMLFVPIISPRMFSEEQHIERITERVEARYNEKGSFTISPLELVGAPEEMNDERYFIVEFEEGGFVFVQASNNTLMNFLVYGKSYYRVNEYYMVWLKSWQRYRFGLSVTDEIVYQDGLCWKSSENKPYNERTCFYECDAEGEHITNSFSPYKVSNIEHETKYLLFVDDSKYIPAVKMGDCWLNLISLENIDAQDLSDIAMLPFMVIRFNYHSAL